MSSTNCRGWLISDIASFTYRGPQAGPHLLILGAVHGNEPCGAVALARLKLELDLGLLTLKAGQLTIAPICNPAAYRQRRRYIDSNLNRIVARHLAPANEEERCANAIVALIESCDYLLDLHSFTAGVTPYLLLDYPSEQNNAFAAALGLGHWVTGWPDLYAGRADLSDGDTVSCAHAVGKSALLVECGQHDDPASLRIAWLCVRRALMHFGLIEPDIRDAAPAGIAQIVRFTRLITRDREGEFARDWQNLDAFVAGEPIIHYKDGETLQADAPGMVLLPKAKAGPGEEWLYLGAPSAEA